MEEELMSYAGIATVIAFIFAIVGILQAIAKMKTVHTAHEASRYMEGEVNLTTNSDNFTHTSHQFIANKKSSS